MERFSLPLGAWDGLRYFIVALPEPSINYFVVVNGVESDLAPVVSGVPQGTVLGPLFSLYINNISADIESEIRLFAVADDVVCYCEIEEIGDTVKLQKDIDHLGSLAKKWGMTFQPVKCNMMQLTQKLTNRI